MSLPLSAPGDAEGTAPCSPTRFPIEKRLPGKAGEAAKTPTRPIPSLAIGAPKGKPPGALNQGALVSQFWPSVGRP